MVWNVQCVIHYSSTIPLKKIFISTDLRLFQPRRKSKYGGVTNVILNCRTRLSVDVDKTTLVVCIKVCLTNFKYCCFQM